MLLFTSQEISMTSPSNTRRLPNIDSKLLYCLQHWPDIEPASGERLEFAGLVASSSAFW